VGEAWGRRRGGETGILMAPPCGDLRNCRKLLMSSGGGEREDMH